MKNTLKIVWENVVSGAWNVLKGFLSVLNFPFRIGEMMMMTMMVWDLDFRSLEKRWAEWLLSVYNAEIGLEFGVAKGIGLISEYVVDSLVGLLVMTMFIVSSAVVFYLISLIPVSVIMAAIVAAGVIFGLSCTIVCFQMGKRRHDAVKMGNGAK